MEAKLYVILGSHACRTGMLLLEHKGIEYEKVELPTGLHPLAVRLRGFSGNAASLRSFDGRSNLMLQSADRMGTVPALLLDGRRVKTNRAIARFLDQVRPDPPLFPAEPERRREVEEAERWGDEVLQMVARRLVLAGSLHDDVLVNGGGEGRLGPLLWRRERLRRHGANLFARVVFGVNSNAEAKLLADLPSMLDHVDAWIESGVLNGEELYAADFMIAPSLALLTYRRDLRPGLERRPSIRLVDRLLPDPSSARTAAIAA
jgi:glutathione S-transferase